MIETKVLAQDKYQQSIKSSVFLAIKPHPVLGSIPIWGIFFWGLMWAN
jgi:hypothetical protein